MSESMSPISMKNRVVRVFLSSTFRDMQEERNVLVRKVFAELRYRCRKRRVRFVEVDLRWGITEEQAHQGLVLPLCLEAIDECRNDFFIFVGLLGELYGWVPESVDPETAAKYPIVEKCAGKSLTELEMTYAALDDPAKADCAHFYFRDPKFIASVPISERTEYVTREKEHKQHLHALKERVRTSGLHFRDNYANPEALGEMILEDLWSDIDSQFPEDEVKEPEDRDAAEHQAYMLRRCEVYVEREDYLKRLDEHVSGDEPAPPLVLLGESGIGKSALLANWAERFTHRHPDQPVFLHFIGSSPESANHIGLVRRLIYDIKKRFGIEKDVPKEPRQLLEELAIWLAEASARGRLVVVIDALNQLEDSNEGQRLTWLPTYFPPNVRCIVSTLQGQTLDVLRTRHIQELTLEGLSREEREQLVAETLGTYRKTLSPAEIDKIIEAPQTSVPIYLTALLEELRIFGIFEELQSKIAAYLETASISELYAMILERWEQDYNKPKEHLVRETLCLLWASRRGLTREEILEIWGYQGLDELPPEDWQRAYLGMHESLIERSGLINFSHHYLRQAVEHKYLTSHGVQKTYHKALADFFQEKKIDDRISEELPWQLCKAEEFERLYFYLTRLEIFERPDVNDRLLYEMVGYWLVLGRYGYDAAQGYKDAVRKHEGCICDQTRLAKVLSLIADLMQIMGKYTDAVPFLKRVLELRENSLGPEHRDTALSINRLGVCLFECGDFAVAESLFRRALEILESTHGPEHPETASAISNMAFILKAKGDYAGAESLYREVLDVREIFSDPRHWTVVQSINNMALLLKASGEISSAVPLLRRGLGISTQELGMGHPITARMLTNLAGTLLDLGNFAEAESLIKQAIEVQEIILGPNHPDVACSMSILAQILQHYGNNSEAESCYKRSLEVHVNAFGADHPDSALSMSNLAIYLYEKGDYAGAEPLIWQATTITKRNFGVDHPATARCLDHLALICGKRGDKKRSERYHKRAFEIRETLLGPTHPDTALSLYNLACLSFERWHFTRAEKLFKRALNIWQEVFGPEHQNTIMASDGLERTQFFKRIMVWMVVTGGIGGIISFVGFTGDSVTRDSLILISYVFYVVGLTLLGCSKGYQYKWIMLISLTIVGVPIILLLPNKSAKNELNQGVLGTHETTEAINSKGESKGITE